MGKFILISGPNNSGKSKYAEGIIAKTTGPRYYIATMIASTNDNQKRIKKHIEQRKNLNFVTLEQPYKVSDVNIKSKSVVLLEDVSNLLANHMFEKNGLPKDVHQDILKLREKCDLLIAVTISGLRAKDDYDALTKRYIDALNHLNRLLKKDANELIDMNFMDALNKPHAPQNE